MVSPNITLENEYLSLVLSIDGLRHLLLRGIPCQIEPDKVDYDISKAQFLQLRVPIIESKSCRILCPLLYNNNKYPALFENLSISLQEESSGQHGLTMLNQTCVGFTVTMFSTLRDVHMVSLLDAGSNIRFKFDTIEIENGYT